MAEFKGKKITLTTNCRQLDRRRFCASMTAAWREGGKVHEWPIVLRGSWDSLAEAEKACREAAPAWTGLDEVPEAWR